MENGGGGTKEEGEGSQDSNQSSSSGENGFFVEEVPETAEINLDLSPNSQAEITLSDSNDSVQELVNKNNEESNDHGKVLPAVDSDLASKEVTDAKLGSDEEASVSGEVGPSCTQPIPMTSKAVSAPTIGSVPNLDASCYRRSLSILRAARSRTDPPTPHPAAGLTSSSSSSSSIPLPSPQTTPTGGKRVTRSLTRSSSMQFSPFQGRGSAYLNAVRAKQAERQSNLLQSLEDQGEGSLEIIVDHQSIILGGSEANKSGQTSSSSSSPNNGATVLKSILKPLNPLTGSRFRRKLGKFKGKLEI